MLYKMLSVIVNSIPRRKSDISSTEIYKCNSPAEATCI